jgi:L-Ala-D/L-Glu epimerase
VPTCVADYADLDLHLWLESDPFHGVGLQNGRFILRLGPGLGAEPTSALRFASTAVTR